MSDDPVHFTVVAPVFPVRDLKASVTYYVDKLGFRTGFEWADADDDPVRYAIVLKDDTELHLTQSDAPHRCLAYFFVQNVSGYCADAAARGAVIAHEIGDQPWGMREFEATDPDGHGLIFAESLNGIDKA